MGLRVVLVDLASWQQAELESALAAAGFEVVATVSRESELYDRVTALAPDVVIANEVSARRDTLESLMNVSARYPRPILMLSDTVEDEVIERAAAGGISTYAVNGVAPTTLRSLIHVAVQHFEERERLTAKLRETEKRMDERDEIARAKCYLMEEYGMSEDNAYKTLRNMAMDGRRRVVAVAREILAQRT